LSRTYVDAAQIPDPDDPDNKTSLAQFIRGEQIVDGNKIRLRAADIPVTRISNEMDNNFYANEFNWSVKVLNYLVDGTGVPWASLLIGALERGGVEVDRKYTTALEEMYKFIGFWSGSLDQIAIWNMLDRFNYDKNDPEHGWEKSPIAHNVALRAHNMITEKEFSRRINDNVFIEMILRELQAYGAGYNPQARVWGSLKREPGKQRLTGFDRDQIKSMLVNQLGQQEMVKAVLGEQALTDFRPLFTDRRVDTLFGKAGLTGQNIVMDLGLILGEYGRILNYQRRPTML
jgi:hypothetical protein